MDWLGCRSGRSWGGGEEPPSLERMRRARLAWHLRSTPSGQRLPGPSLSVMSRAGEKFPRPEGRRWRLVPQRENDVHRSIHLYRLTVEKSRPIFPLANSVDCGLRENRIA